MSSLMDEQVLKIQIVEYKRWPDESIHAAQALANILEIFTKQRATIEAQAQRIAKLEAECQEQSTAKTAFFHGMNDMRDERERLRHELNKQAQRIRELEEKNVLLQSENAALKKYTPWAE